MWECKHCKKQYPFSRTTEKANHSKHCDANPGKLAYYQKVKETNKARANVKFGEYVIFTVNCSTCREQFNVKERERLFPSKERYFCSRKCSNSIGGKAKSQKYGLKQYRTIAEKYYEQRCVVCGVSDILDVHHIDEDRTNIHPSNLLFLCPNDHYRFHRNKDPQVIKAIEGHGAAWGGHFTCNEEVSGIRIPDAPPDYFKAS